MNKNYLIVLNPLPNKQKKYWLNWVINQLTQKKLPYYVYTTSKTLSQNKVFFKNHLSEYSDVVVLGGDGTLHTLANCMPYNTQPITILPCGTGNDFVRNFNYTNTELKALLFSTKHMQIDLGKINDRYFINSAGVGFDAEIVAKTIGHKGLMARFSYLYHAVTTLLFFKEHSLQLTESKIRTQYLNFLTVFANGQFFGGGMQIAPNAHLQSGNLSCIAVEKASLLKKLWAMTQIYQGKHIALKEVSEKTACEFVIETPNLPIQADGELVGETPANVSTQKAALTIKCL